MAIDNIFYINTASINAGWFTGSFRGDGKELVNVTASYINNATGAFTGQFTGSALISSGQFTGSATGAFFGDGSGLTGLIADSASYLDSASGSVVDITGTAYLTGSFSGDITGTASWATNAITAAACTGTSAFATNAANASTAAYCSGTSAFATNAANAAQATYATSAFSSSYASASTSASYAVTAAYAVTASYVTGMPSYKAGRIAGASFGGLPVTYSVAFTTPFTDDVYAVSVIGGNARSWTVENQVSGSFIVSSNSNVALNENVFWTAIYGGESN
jgi:hypothetical protein